MQSNTIPAPTVQTESLLSAARDFLHALDRGYLDCRDDSAFIDSLREAVTREALREGASAQMASCTRSHFTGPSAAECIESEQESFLPDGPRSYAPSTSNPAEGED